MTTLRLLALATLLLAANAQGPASPCRMAPGSTHRWCGLPWELANFQGHYECDDRVKIARPSTEAEVAEVVKRHERVKASGVGHSWWKEQFCSGSDENAVNVVLTEMDAVKPIFALEGTPSARASALRQSIQVDEENGIVTVKAGVPQRMLLDYLAEYTNGINPSGWVVQGYSWFIDQTIGGAVATGTHGSSLVHGSLSNQVLGMEVVLANGTVAHYTKWSHPHYFNALQVSVGRLGVTTKLVMKISPQVPVRRSRSQLSIWEWIEQLKTVQNIYRSAGNNVTEDLVKAIEETQAFWFIPDGDVWRVDFEKLSEQEEKEMTDSAVVSAFDSAAQEQNENPALMPRIPITMGPRAWSNFFRQGVQGNTIPGVFSSRRAYLSVTEMQNVVQNSQFAYDQYEASIPLERAGTCLEEVAQEVYGPDRLWTGFRVPALMRLVASEDAYLSNTNGGARLYINMEDYVAPYTGETAGLFAGRRNDQIHKVLELFRTKCGARMHWGKGGFQQNYASLELDGCFDGSKEYPQSWCHFGCAVQEMDPYGKFQSESSIWMWKASRVGIPVPFHTCCSSTGFDYSACSCDARPNETCASKTPTGLFQ